MISPSRLVSFPHKETSSPGCVLLIMSFPHTGAGDAGICDDGIQPSSTLPPGHRVVSDQSFILAKEITGRYLLPRSLQRFSLTEQAGRSVSPETITCQPGPDGQQHAITYLHQHLSAQARRSCPMDPMRNLARWVYLSKIMFHPRKIQGHLREYDNGMKR